ncbi:MAG: Gmad2 immunoglobulin-like domain-containing protein [Candidatus Falkowbacteria bacterium]
MNIKNHLQKNWPYYFVGLIACLSAALSLLKFYTPSIWVCQDSQWVKQGNPKTPKPTADCGVNLQNQRPAAPAQDGELIIYEPVPNSIVSSTIHIRGQAKGKWYFEGSFPISIVNEAGQTLAQGQAKAQADWMQEGWVPFVSDLSLAKPETGRGFIILKKDNPSGLPANDAEIRLPIRFGADEKQKSL